MPENENSINEYMPEIAELNWINLKEAANLREEPAKWKPIDDFEKGFEQLLEAISRDKDYFYRHKLLLTQAQKWKKYSKSDSILLRGHNLEYARTWLELAKTQPKETRVIKLQKDYIEASTAKEGTLPTDIFISYSRKDEEMVMNINNHLQLFGFHTWFDQESIATGDDFQEEICKGIEQSGTFLFVISPESVTSPYCEDEVKLAKKLHKKIITILVETTDVLPKGLKNIQWLNFEDVDFTYAIGKLVRVLNSDRVYMNQYQLWQQKCRYWEKGEQDAEFLLGQAESKKAKTWLDEALENKKTPKPDKRLQAFINDSYEEVKRASNEERYQGLKDKAISEYAFPLLKERLKTLKKELVSLPPFQRGYMDSWELEEKSDNLSNEVETLKNLLSRSRWHPEKAVWEGDGNGYNTLFKFPCCDKIIQLADSAGIPSQFSADGCQAAPKKS